MGVYRASRRDQRKAKAVYRELARIRTAAATLTDQAFPCAADAGAVAAALRATAPRWWPCPPTVGAVTRPDVGRGEPPSAPNCRGGVALCSSPRSPPTGMTPRRSSGKTKGQISLEQRCHFLKDPTVVDVIFLKKPERLQALGYVGRLALLRYSVVERWVRAHPAPRPTSKRGNRARDPQTLSGDPGLLARPGPPRRGLPQPLPACVARHPGGAGPSRGHCHDRAGPHRASTKFTMRAR